LIAGGLWFGQFSGGCGGASAPAIDCMRASAANAAYDRVSNEPPLSNKRAAANVN
jgi:hypothetical protein